MNETNITIEIHPLQPRWIELEKARYRLYVNDDLLTERTWVWNIDTYIEENIIVNIDTTLSNVVRIEHLWHPPKRESMAQFGLRNLKVNGQPKPDHGGHRSELSFILA